MSITRPTARKWLDLWYAALAEPIGIYIRAPDPRRLTHLLHNAKRACPDPSLDGLLIRTSPRDPKNEIWIVNPPRERPTEAA